MRRCVITALSTRHIITQRSDLKEKIIKIWTSVLDHKQMMCVVVTLITFISEKFNKVSSDPIGLISYWNVVISVFCTLKTPSILFFRHQFIFISGISEGTNCNQWYIVHRDGSGIRCLVKNYRHVLISGKESYCYRWFPYFGIWMICCIIKTSSFISFPDSPFLVVCIQKYEVWGIIWSQLSWLVV